MSAVTAFLANRWVRLGVFGVVLVVLGVLPLIADPFTNQTIARIAVFAVAVLGLNIVMGYTGQVSLGQIFFVGVGAYCAAIPIRAWWGTDVYTWSIVIGLVLAIVVPGVIGLLVALAAARLRGLAIAMITIALPIIGVPLAKRFSDLTGGNEGLSVRRLPYGEGDAAGVGNPFAAPAGSGLANDQWQYYLVLLIAIIVFVLAYFLVRGRYGRAFAIVRENEAVAASMGISPYRYKVLSFTIAAVFGGIAGFLYIVALQYTSSETLSFGHSIELVIATIVGGAGSIVGSILGGAFYVLIPQITNALQLSDYTLVAQGVIILLVLFLLPGGLASLPRTIRRLARRRRGAHSVDAGDPAGSASVTTQHQVPTSKERNT